MLVTGLCEGGTDGCVVGSADGVEVNGEVLGTSVGDGVVGCELGIVEGRPVG